MNDRCYVHGYEPIPEKYFRICEECHHCFVTAEELIEADLKIRQDINAAALAADAAEGGGLCWPGFESESVVHPQVAEDIYICPHCTHDF